MTDFRYGPVEMYLVAYEGEGPDASTFEALGDLLDSGLLRLLDLAIVTKDAVGDVALVEVQDLDAFGLGAHTPAADGIAGDEDAIAFADAMPVGTTAVLLVVELVYARSLAERVANSGGVVLRTERIPAPIVNAVADLAELEAELADAELEERAGA